MRVAYHDDVPTDLSPVEVARLQQACATATLALTSARELPAVADVMPVLNALSIRPQDTRLRQDATAKLTLAYSALRLGTCPDSWLDQTPAGDTSVSADMIEHIADMVDAREYQVAAVRHVLAALA